MIADLVAFLRARLDEDEATARAASPGPWTAYRMFVEVPEGEHLYARSSGTAEHIARHDPARVLQEVEAKRRIVDLYGYEMIDVGTPSQPEFVPGRLADPLVRPALRLMASVYADHPDYREEWKP